MAHVFIPAQLRSLAGGATTVVLPGQRVADIVEALEARFPGMRDALVEGGDLRPGLAVAVNTEMVPLGLLADVGPDDEVHFVPAISGG